MHPIACYAALRVMHNRSVEINMSLKLRFIGDVNPVLKRQMIYFGMWLRIHYEFPVPLEIRLVYQDVLIDFDGTECTLRWWQNSQGRPVKGEIAVKSFDRDLKEKGEKVAFPTVVAAISRVVKYYYQVINDSPIRYDYAEQWGDKVMDAYIDETIPPPPFKKNKANRTSACTLSLATPRSG